ncbi:MAG: hypothetical protein AB2375_08065 [Tissierellaceae bacterium]
MAALGLGSIGTAFFSNLTRYKPLFVVLTTIMLYFSYDIIEKKGANKTSKIIFWISTIVSILILYSPTLIRLFSR